MLYTDPGIRIPGVGNLLVVLCRSNVASSLSVPTKTHHILYTATETVT
jgi:hypothetical protein